MRSPCTIVSTLAGFAGLTAGTLFPASAEAHPLGNNSITQFNVLYLYKNRVELEYFVVFAELPSAELLANIDTDNDSEHTPAECQAWVMQTVKKLAGGNVQIKINNRPLQLQMKKQKQEDGRPVDWYSLSKQPSQVRGLWHLYFMVRFQADFPNDALRKTNTLTFRDNSYPDSFGVKRVLIDLTDEQKKQVTVVEKDVSLVEEEENPFGYEYYNPLDPVVEREGTVRFQIVGWRPPVAVAAPRPGLAADGTVPLAGVRDKAVQQRLRPPPEKVNRLARYFTGGPLRFWTLLLGSLVAIVSGAAHALAPGHAKTAVAAYLISQHGSYRHAVTLAATVTFTHVFFVILMGGIIFVIGAQTGEALQLWLGLVSGAMIAGMGGWLIYRALRGRIGHQYHHSAYDHDHTHQQQKPPTTLTGWTKRLFSHSHPHLETPHSHDHARSHLHGHDHHEHEHGHSNAHDRHDHTPDYAPVPSGRSQITARQIILLGIAGGMVPCPTATLIMLGMISLKRVGLGLYIVGVFSLGLALMLMVVGTLALTSQRFAARILRDETTGQLSTRSNLVLTRLLPIGSGAVVAAFGTLIGFHYAYMLVTNRPLIPWLA